MTAKIYALATLPQHWVVSLSGRMWLVPAIAGGWQARTPYHGQDPEATGADQVPMHITMGCDIPTK